MDITASPPSGSRPRSRLKIGIFGTRGIPNAYGGYEQFAQYLSLGLLQLGHEIWVYNSHLHPYQEKEWKGVHIIHCKDWEDRIGTAGQFLYDLNCLKDARKRKFDILLQLGYTSSSIWYWWWPRNMINIVNMDGLEWKRSKYGKLTRKFLKYAEGLAARHGDVLVADSKAIKEHLKNEYGKESVFIPYGAEIIQPATDEALKAYGLKANEYYLLIARMEPENNIEMIILGYLASGKKYPLVLVGNPGTPFGKELQQNYRDEQVRFLGPIYQQDTLNTIRYYSALYFHGHSVGGTNPSLLEAMASGCTIAAHQNPFNQAILEESAFYFDSAEDVTRILSRNDSAETISEWKEENYNKIRTEYKWQKIIEDYEQLFLKAWHHR